MRLKHFLSVFLTLLTLSVGQMWATDPVASQAPADGSTFVVVVHNGTKYYALPNTITTSSTLAGVEVTVNGSGEVTTENAPTWTLTKGTGTNVNNYWLSYKSGDNTYYLFKNGTGNSNYKFAVGTTNKTYWSFTANGTGYTVAAEDRGTTNHVNIQLNGTTFRCYNEASAVRLLPVAASGPTITKSSSMTTFGCNMETGVPNKQSFTISGTNLKEAISITPPSGYEISTAENGTYQSTAISLSKNGSNAVATTTIWVRLKEDNAAGSYSGNIACESTDATTQNVAVSGSTPFKVTWVANNNTESPYATTYVTYASGEGTALGSLPTDPDPDDYCGDVFYGWYEGSYKNASVAPSVISTSTKITEDKTYNAVFADEEDGGSTIKYKLVSSLTNGKDYIFVSRNTTGSGYALSSSITTGTSTTIEASGDDFFVSGTPANTIIWTLTQPSGYKLQNKNTSTYLKIGGNTFTMDATGSSNLQWSSKGLNGQSSSGKTQYYVMCSNGTFSASSQSGSTTNRVWAYEKTTVSVKTQSNFTTTCCTELGSINGSFFWTTHFYPVWPEKH